jgi:hypothetical protein
MFSEEARPPSDLVASEVLFHFGFQGSSGTAGRVGELSLCSAICMHRHQIFNISFRLLGVATAFRFQRELR